MKKFESIKPIDLRAAFLAHWPGIALLTLMAVFNVTFMLGMELLDELDVLERLDEYIVLLVGVFYGVLLAEMGLHSIWTVFGRVPILGRSVASALAALLLTACLVMPMALTQSYYSNPWKELLSALLCLPILLLAVQTPLWIMKSGWGWQVQRLVSKEIAPKTGRLSIGGLMAATAVVGMAITCVRLAAVLNDAPPLSWLVPWFIVAVVGAVASLLILVPSLVVTLKFRSWILAVSLQLLVTGLVVGGWLVFASVSRSSFGISSFEFLWLFGTTSICCVSGLIVPLYVAQRMGYRLQRYRKPAASVAPNENRLDTEEERQEEERQEDG